MQALNLCCIKLFIYVPEGQGTPLVYMHLQLPYVIL
jgi:hypothetical protein